MLASKWMRKDNIHFSMVTGAGLISIEAVTNEYQHKLTSPKNLPQLEAYRDKVLDGE